MPMMLAQSALSSHAGAWCRYQATGVGSGCVSKWKVSAVRLAHVGSPLESLTAPDATISRNSSQRSSQTAPRIGGGASRSRSSQRGGRHEQGEETRFRGAARPTDSRGSPGRRSSATDTRSRRARSSATAPRRPPAGRRRRAHDADRGHERIARRDPEERGNDVESRQAEAVGAGPLARRLHELARRQDAIAAEQSDPAAPASDENAHT